MLPRSANVLTILLTTLSFSSALPRPESQFHQLSSQLSRRATQADYVSYAVAGINLMQANWYSAATGLYAGAWWNSANVITMLADFQEYFPSYVAPTTAIVFPTTLAQAQTTYPGFLDAFYDDELWWALAWIKVYDVTGQQQYLSMAASIFEDAKADWGTPPCGGLWWNKPSSGMAQGVNAVENELYLTTAAKLANRLPSTPSPYYYLNEAVNAYDWFYGSGLINSQNLINDGLTSTCQNNGGFTFSYTQGIILSGLAELTWATNNETYNQLAITLATAAINTLAPGPTYILHEPCEATGCDGDEQQFKGIFARNIQFLVNRADLDATTASLFVKFLQVNANAIWADDQVIDQLGLVWSGPDGQTATIQTQSSALDAIVGAACVS